jgi:hypothetical protein
VVFTLKNGPSQAVSGFPLVVHSAAAGMTAKVDGNDAMLEAVPLSDSLIANLLRIDVSTGSERRIEFLPSSH